MREPTKRGKPALESFSGSYN